MAVQSPPLPSAHIRRQWVILFTPEGSEPSFCTPKKVNLPVLVLINAFWQLPHVCPSSGWFLQDFKTQSSGCFGRDTSRPQLLLNSHRWLSGSGLSSLLRAGRQQQQLRGRSLGRGPHSSERRVGSQLPASEGQLPDVLLQPVFHVVQVRRLWKKKKCLSFIVQQLQVSVKPGLKEAEL